MTRDDVGYFEEIIQDIVLDDAEQPRFEANRIVQKLYNFWLSKTGKSPEIDSVEYTNEELIKFAQLIGIRIVDFMDLPYVSAELEQAASKSATEALENHKAQQNLKVLGYQRTINRVIMSGHNPDNFDYEFFKQCIAAGWRDTSYGNDAYPSLEWGEEDEDGMGTHRVWLAERNSQLREDESDKEFCLCYRIQNDNGSQWMTMAETDNKDKFLQLLKGIENASVSK